jgi:hypothetical protein
MEMVEEGEEGEVYYVKVELRHEEQEDKLREKLEE